MLILILLIAYTMVYKRIGRYTRPAVSAYELDLSKCKCGNYPKVNDDFIYHSPYGSIVIGIIGSLDGAKIYSTNNVLYMCSEIVIITQEKKRADKLNNLFNDNK